jgi:hypothetical protein
LPESDVTSADNIEPTEVDAFLNLVRATPGPAQRAVDVASQLISEPTESVLAALVKNEFERSDD